MGGTLSPGMDWEAILDPDLPLLEVLLRGGLTYFALFALLRFILKREPGAVGIPDLLVLVLIADAAQNGMSDDYTSIPDGLLLVATILLCSFTLDWLGHRYKFIGRLVHPPPLELVRDGVELRRNMARELITHEELMTHLRTQGVEDLSQVKRAYMEGNGQITVLKHGSQSGPKARRRAGQA